MWFRVIGQIRQVEVIALGSSIRMLAILRTRYGGKRWRKLKGVAVVELSDGTYRYAEIHWYEAHGIGQRRLKIKRFLD